MIWANLFRRKARTFLTLVGMAIGVAAIVALGAAAQGMRTGFTAMAGGSQADLVLAQADAVSVLVSSIEEEVANEMRTWPEVADVDGVLLSNALTGSTSYVYLFGYDPHGFAVAHFRIVEGQSLADAQGVRGRPLLLGRRAAQNLNKRVGDAFEIAGSAFRIVGIYEVGSGFEDGGAVIPLREAQALTIQPRRVSILYVKLRTPAGADRFRARVERQFSDLGVSAASEFADKQQMIGIMDGMAVAIAGLAIVLGGIGMANTLFMSVFERTREIGLLRALGWRRRQVIGLILGESLALSLLGGAAGIGLGAAAIWGISRSGSWVGSFGSQIELSLLIRTLVTVVTMGLLGGAYPAWWAGRLLPVEALQYEGGVGARNKRTRKKRKMSPSTRLYSLSPIPSSLRNLWQRKMRTVFTLLGIGVSIAAIVAMGAVINGGLDLYAQIWRNSQTDLLAIEAGVDSDTSAIDERVSTRIAMHPDVEAVSGMILTAVNTEKMPMLLVFGYHPREYAIDHFRIVAGEPLTAPHQVIVGKQAAMQMGLDVGDTLRLLESNFRVAGIYETGMAYEEIGVVISLREAQVLTGKPRQVMYDLIKLRDPSRAQAVSRDLEAAFPEIVASPTTEAAENLSDFRIVQEMVSQIAVLAVFIGGLGMLNTMLMSVLERTREIGVLRALGWRKRQVLWMILQESLVVGAIGGMAGIVLGVGSSNLLVFVPGVFGTIRPLYPPSLFIQAMVVALAAGVVGGLYPAWRATRMRPVEALRYE